MRVCFLFLLLAAASLNAEDRPSEDSIFGGATNDKPKAETKDAFATGEATDNALTVGGNYYQRLIISAQEGKTLGNTPLSLPLQFDGFLDARPSDRVRGFIDGRLFYDASQGSASAGSFQFSSVSTIATAAAAGASNPLVVLDQAWLKFDIDRKVFITAGKQHVKWGSARFWNPTDFLHTQRRDPLSPTDLRLGNSMIKLAVPWESLKANFYGVILFDNPNPADSLSKLGIALRAEKVFGNTEVGMEFISRGGAEPVVGLDVSSPLGPFDAYLEAALVSGARQFYVSKTTTIPAGADIDTLVATPTRSGPFYQIAAGINYSFAWKDNRLATVGVEAFYNDMGYDDAHVYPALIFFGSFQPFYTARKYAAVYLTAEGPDEQKRTSYTFSTLANLSDSSFLSRLDFNWRILTHLTFESFIGVHYGTRGGEFRYAQDTPNLVYKGNSVPAVQVNPFVVDLGMGLRLAF